MVVENNLKILFQILEAWAIVEIQESRISNMSKLDSLI